MTVNISIITFTLGGRPKYLINCLDSVYDDIHEQVVYSDIKIEHHLIFQGCGISEEVQGFLSYFKDTKCYSLITHEWPENIGIGAGLNAIIPQCKGELIFKMDDDCKIISNNFFESAITIYKAFPNSVFSPYPVGLINNPGGPRGLSHRVWEDKQLNKIWTKRIVTHVGGFARFSPKSLFDNFSFQNDLIPGVSGNEDGQFSSYCNGKGIQMFYLENGMVVEHNESTLGQVLRYKDYFKDRNSESNIKLNMEH